jgi:AmmeMemoRadiSam system protein A
MHQELTCEQQVHLLALAREVIRLGAHLGARPEMSFDHSDQVLFQPGCCFVTLHSHHQLRGCVGSLKAIRPLIEDVAEHAYGSAFLDHRFSPVTGDEVDQLEIEISVLTPEKEIPCQDEQSLLEALTPFQDGLTIEDGFHKATFLPSVWEQLPDKIRFLEHLKQKAGLSKHHWSDQFKAYRYQTLSFSESDLSTSTPQNHASPTTRPSD